MKIETQQIPDCIKVYSHLGYDAIHNVCEQTQYSIQWGADAWAGAVAIFFLLILLGATAFGAVYCLYRAARSLCEEFFA